MKHLLASSLAVILMILAATSHAAEWKTITLTVAKYPNGLVSGFDVTQILTISKSSCLAKSVVSNNSGIGVGIIYIQDKDFCNQ